jgi:hypothetical protein
MRLWEGVLFAVENNFKARCDRRRLNDEILSKVDATVGGCVVAVGNNFEGRCDGRRLNDVDVTLRLLSELE